MTRWDLVYKWSDPQTQSLVDAVTSALENCDRKLAEAAQGAAALDASDPVAQAKFSLHRLARTTEDAKYINQIVNGLVTRLSEGAAPRAEGLEVERLAEAMRSSGAMGWAAPMSSTYIDMARRIAVEYDRRPSDERVPESEAGE